jgi:hypothetical protein
VFQTSISKSMTRVDNFCVQPLRMVGAVFSQQLLRQQSLPVRSTWDNKVYQSEAPEPAHLFLHVLVGFVMFMFSNYMSSRF